MEERIIKILKQNNLYEQNNNLQSNNINKADEFFDTYKINASNKAKFPKNITRDHDGRIILDEIPFIISNKKEEGRNINKWIILNNGTKILLKANRMQYYSQGELAIMYFLKSLNMNTANYDIVRFHNREYLASISFLRNKEKIINPFKEAPNINEGYELLKKYKANIHFLKTCFVDRIYGNVDRFPYNFGIISGGKLNGKNIQERICPLYDNFDELAIFIRDDILSYFPGLGKEYSSCEEVINNLLGYEEIMHWAHGPLKNANLHSSVERLHEEKGIFIDNDLYNNLESFFKDSEEIINSALKSKGEAIKIKLV